MLDKLRRPGRSRKDGQIKKIFTTALFGLICLVFVFIAPMGINITGEGVVAQVGSDFIKSRELRMIEENLRYQYKSRLEQEDSDGAEQLERQIRSRALQELVRMYLINYSLKKEGHFLTDEELAFAIQSIPEFQEKGRFLKTKYIALLKNINLNQARFEENERRRLLANRWQKTFQQAVPNNQLEKEKNQARYQYKTQLRYIELKAEEIEEEQLEPFLLEKNKQEIDRFLKQAQAKWEKTNSFPLLLPLGVPIAHNENIMKAVIEQLPVKGLIPKLIRDKDKLYIVEILSFSEDSSRSEDQSLAGLLNQNFEKANRLFDSWLTVQRENVKIKSNPDQI